MGIRFVHWPDLAITTGTNLTQVFPRHIHDSFCIGLVERGARLITLQDAAIRIAPGEVFVLNPGQPHACQITGAANRYHVINLKPDVMQRITARIPCLTTVRIVDEPIAHAVRQLAALAERSHDPVERESLLVQLLTRLITRFSDLVPDRAAPGDVIRRAQDYIHAYYADKLRLAELARVCHLSPYHLQRTFVEYTGLSPHDYQIHIRIRHSKGLLRQGLSLADVAQVVGFVDQSHFTHSFKRLVGMTPGYFAQQSVAGDQRLHPPIYPSTANP